MNKSRIVITGGNGMLGSSLRFILSNTSIDNYDFIFIDMQDADLTNKDSTYSLFEKIKPNGVVHLAADVGGLYKNINHGSQMFENNILMNINIMQCCQYFKVEKLVSCLSTCIFPEPTLCPYISLPLDESSMHMGPPHPSNEGYAYAKRLVDVQSRNYRKQYGCNFISLAPTNIFGPYDNYSLHNSHVIPALIRKCQEAIENNTDFIVLGTGSSLRQFIYSLDLARLFIWAYFNYNEPEPLILSPSEDEEISISEVAHLIANEFGYKKSIIFDANYPDGQNKRTVANSKLMRLNPSFKFTPFTEAIKSSIDWFKKNKNKARL